MAHESPANVFSIVEYERHDTYPFIGEMFQFMQTRD